LKKGGFCDMIQIVKKQIKMNEELRSKIKWACTFRNCVPMIKNGSLKIIEHTNLAYVELHRVVIKDRLFLFFNNHEYFYSRMDTRCEENS
jgi:hypothetical protein